jgi:hypothetical protein
MKLHAKLAALLILMIVCPRLLWRCCPDRLWLRLLLLSALQPLRTHAIVAANTTDIARAEANIRRAAEQSE